MFRLTAVLLLAVAAFGATNTQMADVAMKGDMDTLRSLVKLASWKRRQRGAAGWLDGAPRGPPTGTIRKPWKRCWPRVPTSTLPTARDSRRFRRPAPMANAPMVEALLKAGADANSFQAEGQTVLMTAARAGNPEDCEDAARIMAPKRTPRKAGAARRL